MDSAESPVLPEQQEQEEEGDEGPDFSMLPEVAWVRIMSNLRLVDKYHLSLTCHTLYQTFQHPSLWRTVKIHFVGSSCNFSLNQSFVPHIFKCMMEHYGHLFQDLHLYISGFLLNLDAESREMLGLLGSQCRLESLTLEVGKITNNFHLYGLRPDHNDVQLLLAFIHNAFRLRRLHLVAWPMHPHLLEDPHNNIFEVMKGNSKLMKSLEALSLFWPRNVAWCEREPLMPEPDYIADLVSGMSSLTTLSIRHPHLSSQLLLQLSASHRPPLKLLEVFVAYSNHNPRYGIPDVAVDAWAKLIKRSPELSVKVTVMSRVPTHEMDLLLRVGVPLTSLTLLKFALCDHHLLYSLSSKFHKTLHEFTCLCDTSPLDYPLIHLVTRCSGLTKLVFWGKVHYRTVERVAQLRRHWQKLDFSWANISTQDRPEGAEDGGLNEAGDDGDQVIAYNANGELYLVDLHRFHQPEEQREERRESMIQSVSNCIGQAWKPSA